jgi:hypothetical protein
MPRDRKHWNLQGVPLRVTRWGHRFSPAIPRLYVGSRKRSRKASEGGREHDALAQLDPELLHFLAERRPGRRVVDADDVAAWAVRDGLEQVAAGAVCERERDEGAPEIVATSASELEQIEVGMQLLGCFVLRARGHVPGWDDQIVGGWRPAKGALEAGELPLGQDAGQGWMYGDAAWDLRLGPVERKDGCGATAATFAA